MVERLNGIQEASGSNPLISTKPRIRAHFAPFLHSDLGYLRLVNFIVLTIIERKLF